MRASNVSLRLLLGGVGLAIVVFSTLSSASADYVADNFEDGVIDPSMWVTHGYKGGPAGVGSGSWQYTIDEHVAADGYLQARIWGPPSGNTYGAEAWARTIKNFNDGNRWLINFKWSTSIDILNTAGPGFTIGIVTTDSLPDANDIVWWQSHNDRPDVRQLYYNTSRGNVGYPPDPPFSAQTWSVVIDPSGSATLYEGADGLGTALPTVQLDQSKPWHWGAFVDCLTAAGYDGGDANFRLYDFKADAVPEPSSIIIWGIGVSGLVAYAWRRRTRKI
jgi:hypothetical protein